MLVSSNKRGQSGFTIIELMISLTFIAFLLMFIVSMTLRVTNLYSKGMTLKSINQASRTVVEQMSRDIAESSNPIVYLNSTGAANGGVMCTDRAVYLWNKLTTSVTPASSDIRYAAPDVDKPIRLMRSTNQALCKPSAEAHSIPYAPTGGENTELLSESTAVVSIMLSRQQNNLYRLTVRLGTSIVDDYETSGGETLGTQCKIGREGEFCHTVEFERIIYAPRAR